MKHTLLRHIEEASDSAMLDKVKQGDRHEEVVEYRCTLIAIAKSYSVSTRLIAQWLCCSLTTINRMMSERCRRKLTVSEKTLYEDITRRVTELLETNT